MKPEFVVCDEVTSALDVSVQASVVNLLRELQREFNTSYLFISHDLSTVREISHRIAVMYLGKIVKWARWSRFFSLPTIRIPRPCCPPSRCPCITQPHKSILLEGPVPSPASPPVGLPLPHALLPAAVRRLFHGGAGTAFRKWTRHSLPSGAFGSGRGHAGISRVVRVVKTCRGRARSVSGRFSGAFRQP